MREIRRHCASEPNLASPTLHDSRESAQSCTDGYDHYCWCSPESILSDAQANLGSKAESDAHRNRLAQVVARAVIRIRKSPASTRSRAPC